jgi:hypothetical protein
MNAEFREGSQEDDAVRLGRGWHEEVRATNKELSFDSQGKRVNSSYSQAILQCEMRVSEGSMFAAWASTAIFEQIMFAPGY